jgi:hypothetical protein
LVSTYQNYNNIANGIGYDMFDNASSASSYWASNIASWVTNYLDGVAQTQPTQNQYSATGVYILGVGMLTFFLPRFILQEEATVNGFRLNFLTMLR